MTVERIKGNVAFTCDLEGCDEAIETGTGDFRTALDEATEDGWRFLTREGAFKHFCRVKHAEMDYRGENL